MYLPGANELKEALGGTLSNLPISETTTHIRFKWQHITAVPISKYNMV